MWWLPDAHDLGRATGGRDFFGRLPAEFVRADGQRLADLAAPEHFDEPLGARHEPTLEKKCRRDDRAGVEPGRQRVQIHDLVLDAERIVKSALRDAAVQRHLAAFKPAFELESRPRLRALVPAPGGLAVARSLAAADSFLRVFHATRWFQIVETHN